MPRQEVSRRLDVRKTFKNYMLFNGFLKAPKAKMMPLGEGFGVVLGPLGRSWSPLGRLGRVLRASWERLGATWTGI